jgi:hypothetical protein
VGTAGDEERRPSARQAANGIRSSLLDFLYRDEIERFTAEGVLDHLHVAASRERPGRHDHVQDRIREQGALVWRLLASGGYVYVCGSQPMRVAVRAAFVDVISEHGSLPRERKSADGNMLAPQIFGANRRPHGRTALILTIAALVMFALRRRPRAAPQQISLGLVFLTAGLICQFTSLRTSASEQSGCAPGRPADQGRGRRRRPRCQRSLAAVCAACSAGTTGAGIAATEHLPRSAPSTCKHR